MHAKSSFQLRTLQEVGHFYSPRVVSLFEYLPRRGIADSELYTSVYESTNIGVAHDRGPCPRLLIVSP